VYPSQVRDNSRSHAECTVLTVTINAGSDPKWHVAQDHVCHKVFYEWGSSTSRRVQYHS